MPDLALENALRADGFRNIAGIDEAGRGPLAGPVVAAAVILPDDYAHPTLNDSKQLSAARREALYAEITADTRIAWASALVEADEIDRINILQSTYAAMRKAVTSLPRPADIALIDGRPVPQFPLPHRGVVKGDSLSLSIAAASIIAKVERDRLMADHHQTWPAYGFGKHKGYGTAAHLAALREHGPCPIHRRSFAPVRDALDLKR
ncbi:MAG: ribonuclease HII [Verrucomicrobiae bacterium]|nr:ribonuclease HII [Verrucomicrobiae bacterium]